MLLALVDIKVVFFDNYRIVYRLSHIDTCYHTQFDQGFCDTLFGCNLVSRSSGIFNHKSDYRNSDNFQQ